MNTPDYDFIPLPLQQSPTSQKIIIQSDPNTQGGQNMLNIQQNAEQSKANTQFDTVNTNVKPITGGGKDIYTIEFKNKKFIIKENKEDGFEEIIKKFMKKQNFKNDHLLTLYDHQNKSKSLYHIKDTKNMKIRKLY